MKVLQLSTHSTLAPRHGGQLRSHHIGRCLENEGFDLSRIAICWRTQHDIQDEREPIIDLRFSQFWSSETYGVVRTWDVHLADYYSAVAVAETPKLVDQLLRCITVVAPDVLLVEHPWSWPLIKNWLPVTTGAIRVIYSSHNVEAILKRRMNEDARVPVPAEVLDAVEALERDLVTTAHATITCTDSDAEVFRSWGARQVVVANNGTAVRNRAHLLDTLPLPLRAEHRFVLFLGSAYGPNVSGFFKYVAPALMRLRPNTRVVITGTMCDAIDERISSLSLRHYVDRRLVSLGFVDSLTLDALLANASAVLLPIEYGGGSHLKTAEALVAGRPIVGTSASFRGFRAYQGLSRVTIADTPEDFEAAIHKSLSAPDTRSDAVAVPRELLWEATLQPAVELVRSISAPASIIRATQPSISYIGAG